MISSGSEQPIGDPDSNSFIEALQTHENLTGEQVACVPYKNAVKAPRLRVHVMPSRATSNGASSQRGWSVPVPLSEHWACPQF
jgi:hypothetical protein